ncbi:MAG: glycosyltransferase family 4 protein [Candidatus Acidiferrum sp.]|jgi:glycosyltransferase involved in cell wall biosynthesis
MNVLFVDLDRDWRGGQSQALLLLRGLRAAGHRVELIAARDAPLARRSAAEGIVVTEVSQNTLRFSTARAIRRRMGSVRFDLVHVNEPHALTAAWLAHAHKRAPLLFSRRILFLLKTNWISQARFRAVTRFLPNSKAVAQKLMESGIAPARISMVNEGVEIPVLVTLEKRTAARRQYGLSDREFVFGCVSFLVEGKGQEHLIAALAKVRETHPEARLLLAGDGPRLAEFTALTKQFAQEDAVRFLGFVQDVGTVYAALDAFVFPSEFEALGTALQTALALEIPCISTVCGGLGEVVEAGRTALVAEPNGPAFAAAMAQLIEHPELRERLRKAARADIQLRLSAGRMVENTIKVYEDVLRRK